MAQDYPALTALALFAAATARGAAPLCIAAIGGAFSAQVNVFNVGLDGMILLGAFAGFAASDATGSVVTGLLGGSLAGGLLAAVLAYCIVILKANEVVAGIAANLGMVGLTSTLLKSFYKSAGAYQSTSAGLVPTWIHNPFSSVPVIGPFLGSLDLIMLSAAVLAVAAHVFLYRSRHGLRMRAIGDRRAAAAAAGLPIRVYTYAAFLIGGLLCGLAGAYLPLSGLSMFSVNMTAGTGFIALAAVLFGSGRPIKTALSTLIFGAATAATFRLQNLWVPPNIVLAAPYLATIGALVLNGVRHKRAQGKTTPGSLA